MNQRQDLWVCERETFQREANIRGPHGDCAAAQPDSFMGTVTQRKGAGGLRAGRRAPLANHSPPSSRPAGRTLRGGSLRPSHGDGSGDCAKLM